MSIIYLAVASTLFMGAAGAFSLIAVNAIGAWHDRRARARVMRTYYYVSRR
jgi:hypothetical protein